MENNGAWGPSGDNWNIALFKNIIFTEQPHLELRFESYNTFNPPRMNAVDTIVGDPNSGKVTSADDRCVFQFGARTVF